MSSEAPLPTFHLPDSSTITVGKEEHAPPRRVMEDAWKPKIVIVEDLCKGCGICIDFCPVEILKAGSRMTKKGVFPPEVIDPAKCTACRICQYYCPDLAIFIVGGSKASRS